MHSNQSHPFAARNGFTLLEALFGLAMLGIAASAALWALVNMNNVAAESRLYTGAITVAQNQIDLLLSDGPYNPQKSQIPSELSTAAPTVQNNVPIYTDPITGIVVVSGTVTTTVTPTGQTVSGYSLNTVFAKVTVTYRFRNRTYNVSMWTLRTSDV